MVVPTSERDSYWDQQARKIITALILFVSATEPDQKNLTRVKGLLSLPTAPKDHVFGSDINYWEEVIASMKAIKNYYGGVLVEMANEISSITEKAFTSIMDTARLQFEFLDDLAVRKALQEHSAISFNVLAEENTTIFVIIPDQYLSTQGWWLRLVIGMACKAMQEAQAKSGRCLFILEEMASLMRMSEIEDGISRLSGYGIDFVLVLQNLTQLQNIYGREQAQTIIGNCTYEYYLNIQDIDTAKHVSQTLGQQTVKIADTNRVDENYMETFQRTGKPLKSPDELINRYGAETGFLFQSGQLPAMINPLPYYEDQELNTLVDQNPLFY